jgi:PAS domain S-box-containing protein
MPLSKTTINKEANAFKTSAKDEYERLKEKLTESEKKYREIFENIQDVFFEVGIDGTIIELSPSIATATKYQREELIGKSIYGLYSDRNERERLLDSMKKSGKINDYEITLKDKDGTLIPSSVSAKFVLDASGKPIKTMGIIRNITKRKLAEKKLHDSEQYITSLLQAIPDLIFVLDAEGIFIDLKSGDSEDLAMPKELFLGKKIFAVLPKPIAAQIKTNIDAALRERTVKTFEYQLPVKKGLGFYECKISLFGDNKVIAIVRNITERKREQESLAAKTAILNAQLETSTEGILAIDNEGHTVISNKHFSEMWKIPQKIMDTKDDKKMLALL